MTTKDMQSECSIWIAGHTYVLSFNQERMYWHFVKDNMVRAPSGNCVPTYEKCHG